MNDRLAAAPAQEGRAASRRSQAPRRPEPHQLVLPFPVTALGPRNGNGVGIAHADRVFVNRNLKLSDIEWVGFDMDYTLAIYRQSEMDALSIDLTAERMIRRGYPDYLKGLSYDTRFPIRGLLIDRRLGHILKMDRYKVVHRGYHGMRRLGRAELSELYQTKRIRPGTPRFHWIDTLFALSEVTAYAAIVDAMEKRGTRINYDRLFTDVRASIDEAHADGTVYGIVMGDADRYVDRDPDLARTLHKLRSAGKRLFLLTNSPWSYTDRMMSYLLGAAMPEYPTWQHYFDFAVCSAAKPLWFKEGRPFVERTNGTLRPVNGPLERGGVYEGGNLWDFERLLGLRGSSVLYVGDHIYGDIVRSKKESSWRTAMIIQELDDEIAAHESCADDMARQRLLEEHHDHLEDELRYYQARYKELTKRDDGNGHAERVRAKRMLERIRGELKEGEAEYDMLGERIDRRFHPYWGSLLKEGNEMSVFGLQVETYADIYMRRVSCLKAYSPQQYYRSPHDRMPHEL